MTTVGLFVSSGGKTESTVTQSRVTGFRDDSDDFDDDIDDFELPVTVQSMQIVVLVTFCNHVFTLHALSYMFV